MVDVIKLTQRMKRLGVFKHLSLDDLKTILLAGQFKQYKEDAVIFLEQEPCSGLHVLLRGLVKLVTVGPDGRENTLTVIQPVIMFNEVAVLDGGLNPCSAIADKDSLIWRTSLENFQVGLARYPELALELLPILAGRNRRLINHCKDLSFKTVRARTAKLLLELSEGGTIIINRRELSIQEIASRVVSVPEAVSRSISYMRDLGVILSDWSTIEVIQVEKLAELAQIDTSCPIYMSDSD